MKAYQLLNHSFSWFRNVATPSGLSKPSTFRSKHFPPHSASQSRCRQQSRRSSVSTTSTSSDGVAGVIRDRRYMPSLAVIRQPSVEHSSLVTIITSATQSYRRPCNSNDAFTVPSDFTRALPLSMSITAGSTVWNESKKCPGLFLVISMKPSMSPWYLFVVSDTQPQQEYRSPHRDVCICVLLASGWKVLRQSSHSPWSRWNRSRIITERISDSARNLCNLCSLVIAISCESGLEGFSTHVYICHRHSLSGPIRREWSERRTTLPVSPTPATWSGPEPAPAVTSIVWAHVTDSGHNHSTSTTLPKPGKDQERQWCLVRYMTELLRMLTKTTTI